MSDKNFKIKPKVWPKEYTFEEFKQLNPTIAENLLINYYNKYLHEYAQDRSRHLNHFNDTKDNLSKELLLLNEKLIDNLIEWDDGDMTVGPTGASRAYRSPLDQIKHSVYFDGVDDYARAGLDGQIPRDGTLKPYGQLTIAAWVEAKSLYDVGSTGGYFTIYGASTNGGFRMFHYHKRFNFTLTLDDGDSTKKSTLVHTKYAMMKPGNYWSHTEGALSGSGWHYVVATYDGRTVNLYIDGQLGDEGASTDHTDDPYGVQSTGESGSLGAIFYDHSVGRNKVDVSIGSYTTVDSLGAFKASGLAEHFSGSIAEIAFWDTALDATTIKDIYDNNASGSGAKYDLSYAGYPGADSYDINDEGLSYKNVGSYASNLQGWWKMDENTGTTLKDFSGKGRNMTTYNSPTWSGSYAPGS
jgi:hypothetical protein